MTLQECLLRGLGREELCEPFNPVYIGMHGLNGDGGRLAQANVPKEFRSLLLQDSPAKDDQASIYRKLEVYKETFDRQFKDIRDGLLEEGKSYDDVRVKSLYLWSEEPGTGKTTTAVALLNEYLVKSYIGSLERGVQPSQRPVYFLDANQLQTDYNTFNRPRVPEDIAEPASRRYYRAIERAKHTEFVVIDDMGVRDATEGFRTDLHSVINYRVTNEMPTVYTSNIPIRELPNVYGEKRLADRTRKLTQEIHFDGESKRGVRK